MPRYGPPTIVRGIILIPIAPPPAVEDAPIASASPGPGGSVRFRIDPPAPAATLNFPARVLGYYCPEDAEIGDDATPEAVEAVAVAGQVVPTDTGPGGYELAPPPELLSGAYLVVLFPEYRD